MDVPKGKAGSIGPRNTTTSYHPGTGAVNCLEEYLHHTIKHAIVLRLGVEWRRHLA
jgi:hypothetical protein